jgi:hypothetical protein
MDTYFDNNIWKIENLFKKSICVYYLRLMSISNLGQIIIAVLIRTLNNGLQINLLRFKWICKIREFLVHYFALISFTCICLATIDQYLVIHFLVSS